MRRTTVDRSLPWIALLCGVLGIAALSMIGCAPTMGSKAIQGGVIASQLADLHSTKLALDSGRGREANPLLPDAWWQQGLIKAAGTVGILWLGTTLEVRGHRTLARIAQGSIAALTAVIAARNYQIARGK